jgi:amino acid adenylation domain-containing protein
VRRDVTIINVQHEPWENTLDRFRLDQETPFNLDKESGWRVKIYKRSESKHIISIVYHCKIADDWSIGIIYQEIRQFYAAILRGDESLKQKILIPIQYVDYSAWQRKHHTKNYERQLEHWIGELKSSRPAELPCDKSRPKVMSGKTNKQKFHLDGGLSEMVRHFAKQNATSVFVVLLAAFRAAHYRITGATDAVVGTPCANRDMWEVREMVGLVATMQCLRIKLEDESFKDLVKSIRNISTTSFANKDIPLGQLVAELKAKKDSSRNPLVQIVSSYHSQPNINKLTLDDVETEFLDLPVTSRYDLEFNCYQKEEGIHGEVIFSTDIFAQGTANRLLSVFESVLEAGINEPDEKISSLPLLTKDDYAVLVDKGLLEIEKTDYPRESSLIDLWVEQVAKNADSVAIKDKFSQFTYSELDQKSLLVARWLRSRNFAPETLVGVFSNPNCQTIMTYLGIMRANLAYLPFDTKTPPKRLETILSSFPGHKLVLVASHDGKIPEVRLENVEFVHIRQVLEEEAENPYKSDILVSPSATSLAYVMFTSGSTGKPKGVMIQHRGITRIACGNEAVKSLPAHPTAGFFLNIAFDGSTWEIYTTLLNGGKLICVDITTILDPMAALGVFTQEQIQTVMLTPALVKQYVQQCPDIFRGLRQVMIAGEALHPRDVSNVQSLTDGIIYNFYGPTENTVGSAYHRIRNDEDFPNGTPIGKVVENSGGYILDTKQKLVPIGVVGELVVTGDGLARGYTDTELNKNRFVEISIGSQGKVRAYRTGDMARYRPTDGLLEFCGRIDGQIKLRGQRIELGEIEHCLLDEAEVNDAAVVLCQDKSGEQFLAAFASAGDIDLSNKQDTKQQENADQVVECVQEWEQVFDTSTYVTIEDVKSQSLGRDFTGWTSMYDGNRIDEEEMNEWLNDTLDTLQLCTYPLQHVLEIGSGSGMILFNLPNEIESYVGLDPSNHAVNFVAKALVQMPKLRSKVRIHKASALDIDRIPMSTRPDTVIFNSVLQYFPTLDYLNEVIMKMVHMDGVRTIFFGDVRSFALYEHFLLTRSMFILGDDAKPDELKRTMEDMRRGERELLVDPAFFVQLQSRYSDRIEHVEVVPKRMKATNELSCYRYAAVLHLRPKDAIKRLQVLEVKPEEWTNYSERNLDRSSLLDLLNTKSITEASPLVAIKNIPDTRVLLENLVISAFKGIESGQGIRKGWLLHLRGEVEKIHALSAYDLEVLAKIAGYQVEISCAQQSNQQGGLDVVFHRLQTTDPKDRVLFRFPNDTRIRTSHSLSTHPVRRQMLQVMQDRLLQTLKESLPSYMVPQSLTVLDHLPVNANGKIDRQALVGMATTRQVKQKIKGQPQTATEKKLQLIWAHALNMKPEVIGLDDHLFKLGGDSMTAMKVVKEAYDAGLTISIADIFRSKTLQKLAETAQNKFVTTPQKLDEYILVETSFKEALLSELDILSLGYGSEVVEDIWPLSDAQKGKVMNESIFKHCIGHFWLDLGKALDVPRLIRSCQLLMERFPTLRSSFLSLQGNFWQIIHREFPFEVKVEEIDGDVEQASVRICSEGWNKVDRWQIPTAFTLLKHETQGFRFILQIAHVQYDIMSISTLFQYLMNLYKGNAVVYCPPITRLLAYTAQRRSKSIDYWRNLLQGSSVTSILPIVPKDDSPGSVPKALTIKRQTDIPQSLGEITTATFCKAAWALVLSIVTGETDVVFGTVVNGRNSALEGVNNIFGDCAQAVPVRCQVLPSQDAMGLLESIQQQFLEMGEADSLGIDEITRSCTSWSDGLAHGCSVQHVNADELLTVQTIEGEAVVQFHEHPGSALPIILLESSCKGGQLMLELTTVSNLMTEEAADAVMDLLVQVARRISVGLYAPLEECLSGLKLEL